MKHIPRQLLPSVICALYLTGAFLVNSAFADTIVLKDSTKTKGLVVDEYVDRIVVSTYEGEIFLSRSDIEDIIYE